MINIVDIQIKESETEPESGDIYHKAEITLLEPGGAFSEEINKDEIIETIKKRIQDYNNAISEIVE